MSPLVFVIIILVLIILIAVGSQKPKSSEKKKVATKKAKPSTNKKTLSKEKPVSLEERAYQNYLKNFSSTKNAVKLSPLRSLVAGVRYKNDDTGIERQLIIRKLKQKEILMLIPDMQNAYDPNAVRVIRLNGEQIGFLNTDLAIEIKARLMEGLRVDTTVKEVFTKEGFLEVTIELIRYSRKKIS